jgi:hypothetical protein
MAFDKTPTTWLPSWSEDATNITLPLASLPELTAAEADAATARFRNQKLAETNNELRTQLRDKELAEARAQGYRERVEQFDPVPQRRVFERYQDARRDMGGIERAFSGTAAKPWWLQE